MLSRINWLLILSCVCCLAGCGALRSGTRFYEGTAFPGNKVGILLAVSHCSFSEILDKREMDAKFLLSQPSTLELLPGQYLVSTVYIRIGTYTNTAGRSVQRELDVQPGNIYVVYPEFITNTGNWRPIIMNIEDYSKEMCKRAEGGDWGTLCPEKSELQQRAAKYLQGERRIMHFHPSDKPVGNIKGSWY